MRKPTRKPLSPFKRFVAVRIVPWFVLLCGAFGVYVGIEDILRAAATTRWPSVDGTVVRSVMGVPQQAYSGDAKYVPEVAYEYIVDGVDLTGSRITATDSFTNDRSRVQEILDRYPVGRRVTVHYRPDAPGESVLEPGLRALTFLIPGIAIPTTLIGLGLVLFAPRLLTAQRGAHVRPLPSQE